MLRKVLTVLVTLLVLLPMPLRDPAVAAAAPRVTYDHHSLMIDGRRVVVQAAEVHYFRLPSPGLWRDVLEKIRAGGFNAISVYFDWAYHSPKPGVYDFTGVRDVDRFLRTAERAGLYVIARPGPYINAETTGGGFPGWLKNVPGRARSSDAGFTEAYRDWLHHINPIIARHQVGHGGSVILYNAENEYAVSTDAAYMQDIQDQARADGVDVPITTNDCCDAGSWSSTWAEGPGAVQIPGVDDYPQSFDCANAETVWGPWGEGTTERLRDDAPVFAAEYQAGAIDGNDAGYDRCRELTGPAYMKYFYKSNLLVSGATLFNYYMGFGGTNWGFLAQPNDVYTSYDYGAAVTEARGLTAKYDEFKRQGYFLQAVAPLAKTDPTAAPTTDNPAIGVVARANPDTGTRFALVRHADRAATTADTATLSWTVPDGTYSLPVQVKGRDAHVLVGGYDMGGQRLAASSSEILTHAFVGGRDVAVLYGTAGSTGATILRYSAKPRVTVLEGDVRSTYSDGNLRLDYTHERLARVLITGGGRRPLLLLLGTDETAATFWRTGTDAEPVLVRGTSLVRSTAVDGGTVRLAADTAEAGEVEVFAEASRLRVGDAEVRVTRTPSGSLLGRVPGPREVRLPALRGWRVRDETPEATPGFDDSSWRRADKTTTESPMKPPMKPEPGPVLYADDYGFHYGDVWYRGRFTATGAETAVALNAITGRRGRYLVWLDGRYLGSAAGGTEADADAGTPDPGPGRFAIPAGLLKPGRQATLAVLVQNMGHNDDWTADDNRFKQPRGLVAAAVEGSAASIAWKIQGARGGEDLPDPVRGPLNTGGLYGERSGWHLPGYPDRSWDEAGSPADRPLAPGVTWYRTGFRLDLPEGQDVSVGLRFGGDIPAAARVVVYLNGWNVGQYGGGIGPQKEFVLPAGLLREHGRNTLALALTATERASGGPGPIGLFAYGNVRGGVTVPDVPAPSYPLAR
ncbi:beta-galactosidase [Microbispora sp. CA-102843]|uniref:beta-galactosidase n=1 Tax=Microbispora sp. CA-102843 TaxID=3239952 RepID=UPI003D9103A2